MKNNTNCPFEALDILGNHIDNSKESVQAWNCLYDYITQKEVESLQSEIKMLRKTVNDMTVKVVKIKEKLPLMRLEAIEGFIEKYKKQIENYTGIFIDEDFYISYKAILSAIDFVLDKEIKKVEYKNEP